MYSHDGLGFGHARRNLAIATALTSASSTASVLLATSGGNAVKIAAAGLFGAARAALELLAERGVLEPYQVDEQRRGDDARGPCRAPLLHELREPLRLLAAHRRLKNRGNHTHRSSFRAGRFQSEVAPETKNRPEGRRFFEGRPSPT